MLCALRIISVSSERSATASRSDDDDHEQRVGHRAFCSIIGRASLLFVAFSLVQFFLDVRDTFIDVGEMHLKIAYELLDVLGLFPAGPWLRP
jgi:hypothetical protein